MKLYTFRGVNSVKMKDGFPTANFRDLIQKVSFGPLGVDSFLKKTYFQNNQCHKRYFTCKKYEKPTKLIKSP